MSSDDFLLGPVVSPPDNNSATHALARNALLATRRNELLTPVQAILEIADRLLGEGQVRKQANLVLDLQRLRAAAVELHQLIDSVLTPDRLAAAASGNDWRAVKSHIRHDMLNRLNPVINYSEMWLEETAEPHLVAFIPDLELLRNLGKQCFALIDRILDSWDMSATIVTESAGPDLQRITEIVARMKRQQPEKPFEIGRLLIVDDNSINRDILRRLLESQGHVVAEAADGRQALDLLARDPFDVILLDVVMPEMDGFEVLARLKSDPRLREISVIMISALNELEYVVNCIQMGAEDYLHRPYNSVFLKARIGACLEKRRLREREIEHLEQIEVERRRADELLHVILPREVVAELKRSNTFVPRRYDGVAVIFADIVDFTPYCDRHTPEDVVQHLQALVETWEEAALKYEIQKIKTIGDAFMAACGLLSKVDNPVLNCLRFGQEMIAATQSSPTGWNLRVGIHYGPVIGGVLGRRQYLFDLFGDTVNTAARMESHGVNGRIVLSCDAWKQVETMTQCTPLDPAPIKGKGVLLRYQFGEFCQ